jgi:ABC-2 type transport system ATP-binding protein
MPGPDPSPRPAPLVRTRGVVKSYGRRRVLDGVDLHVAAGEAVALVGENGAGKTTLLRTCAGLIRPDGGEVHVEGRIGYCPQEPGLLDLLNANEHLVLFGRGLGRGRDRALDAGSRILKDLHFPVGDPTLARDLSGGSRQKLNLALALIGDPRVLLLDEPYQGFDHGTYVDFWAFVDAWRTEGRAVLIVTHMLAELTRVDRVVELSITPWMRAA